MIDETNQATGKHVFPRALGAAATGLQFPRARATRTPTTVQFQLPRGWEHMVKPLHSPGYPE